MQHDTYKKTWAVTLAIVLILAFAFQGSRGLWEPDEGRYVRCAYEMLKTGNLVTPTINYKPHFTKPPITYWLIASGLSVFGKNEWGARAFHGLAFALTAMLVGLLGKQMWDDRTGLTACLVYASAVTPFAAGNVVTADCILTFFETLAVVCFWMSVTRRNEVFRSSLWALAMWLFFGAAFMTKGPPGLLPLAGIIAYLLILKKTRRLPVIVTLLGILLFAVTSLWWYVLVIRQHEGLLSYFLEHEVVGRTLAAEHNRYPGWFGPIRIYLPVLTLGALPWSCFWLAFMWRSRPRIFSLVWWKSLRERPILLFLLLWLAIPLLIFCLSSSRLPLYVLPLFAPLALATAQGLNVYFPSETASALNLRGRPAIAIVALALILVCSKLVAAHVPIKKDSRAMWEGICEIINDKTGGAPYEIVVHKNYDGLAFYSDANVERLTTRTMISPSFVSPEHMSEEFDELLSVRYIHVFLVRRELVEYVLSELKSRGVPCSVSQAPFAHALIFCEPVRTDTDAVDLAFLGDTGTGDSNQKMIGNTLYHLDQLRSLEGVILLGDTFVEWHGEGAPAQACEKYFDKPYAPLLENGVPFYAVLGNHDLDHGMLDFYTNYPLFNMRGKRFSSKVFGDDIVEVFFLDSNTIQNDAVQVEWLRRALEHSRALWKVVAMHHPLYSTTRKSSDISKIQLLEPPFVKYGADLVLSGHNHVYERLHPIRGVQYITVGSGGKLDEGGLLPENPQRIAGTDRENATLVLRFTRDSCSFAAYTLNEKIVDEGKFDRYCDNASEAPHASFEGSTQYVLATMSRAHLHQ